MAQFRELIFWRLQQERRVMTILDVGQMNTDGEEKSIRVEDDIAPKVRLSASYPRGPLAFVVDAF